MDTRAKQEITETLRLYGVPGAEIEECFQDIESAFHDYRLRARADEEARRKIEAELRSGGAFGPAAFLAKLEEDAPERARQILDRVWIGKGCLTQGEAEWLDKQHPGDAWPVQKALAIAARDGNPPPKIAAKHFPPPTTTETP